MNLKILSIVFLCVLGVSMICDIAMLVPNMAEELSYNAGLGVVRIGYLTNNGTDPGEDGDGDGGGGDLIPGGWP